MSDDPDARDGATIARSRRLSWLLRHGGASMGLPMDEAGWVPIAAVLAATGLDLAQLQHAVATNDKRRLQLDGDRVRACQGHSRDNTAVTREGLERSWQPWTGTTSLWHGTDTAAIAAIAIEGLSPMRRTHVHLADDPAAKVGKRAQVAWLLEVDPARLRAAGLGIFVAPNGVVLVRHVPRACIIGAHPRTRRAHAERATVLATLGLCEPVRGS